MDREQVWKTRQVKLNWVRRTGNKDGKRKLPKKEEVKLTGKHKS